jgi:alpha-beta hydrolase superfamily lysophospholipase
MRPAIILLCALASAAARSASPETVTLTLRGEPQALHVLGTRGSPPVVVASGDGGFVHAAPLVAETLAARGFFVVGLDSRAYLSSFTREDRPLAAPDVASDFAALADFAAAGKAARPVLVGVSEGAALEVLAAAGGTLQAKVAGLVCLGLPDEAELGWHLRDAVIYLTRGNPREPLFSTAAVIGRVSLPVVAIHSSRDEFVPLDEVRRVMAAARDPKQLWIIDAENHRFSGKEQELEQKLVDALAWIGDHAR